MEKFDLSIWLKDKNRKVVTRDGKPVRIVCWDKLGYYHIIGCIRYSDNCEEIETYNIDGSKYFLNEEDPNDLFFADEEENLSEEKIRKDIVAAVETYGDFTQGRKEEIYTWLKKQGEQKPADKVDSKFKIGDWIVYEDNIWKICYINLNTYYELLNLNSELSIRHIEGVDKTAHLWTIQDAKEGDVLNSYRVKATIIFKGWNSDGKHINAYCALQQSILIKQEMLWDRDFEPATKEQSDLFFQKMKEAGYEWDIERKELKKIEQKSAEWSEEDKEMLKDIISGLKAQKSLTFAHDNQGNAQMNARIDWLQSLPEKFVLEPKQEWSEEDEETLNIIANHIRNDGRYSSPILANKYADFILSIKPKNKWKPSEEQMKWLKDVIETVPMTCRQQLPLESLYNDLKKL